MTSNKSPGGVASSYAMLVLALSVGVVFLNLGSLPLASLNEARRALPIREMFLSGDWLIPTLNGEWYIVKPPFYYWIAAALATAIGTVNEWVVRFPAAVAGLLTLALCYRAMIRYASPWAAIFAVQILIANSGFAVHARRAELEGLLTLFCFASLLCAWRYLEEGAARTWGVASYALLGCAVMTKGPVSLLFVTLPLLVYAFVQQDARGKKLLRDPLGWLILLLVSLPWYGLITERIGFDAWQPILKRDIVQKISGHVESEPFYSYLQWIAGAFFPGTPAVVLEAEGNDYRLVEKQDRVFVAALFRIAGDRLHAVQGKARQIPVAGLSLPGDVTCHQTGCLPRTCRATCQEGRRVGWPGTGFLFPRIFCLG
jgi:4-amino-4-deoxy-L-arabinose transferase-like glycosyltransferase